MSLKDAYDYYVTEGLLDARTSGGLTLYNYSSKCVFTGNWNHHTMTARGLVLDAHGNVVARPLPKFFNVNERPETMLSALPSETPELSDKYDGSLIIAFVNPETGKWQAVTRGCWDNAQTQFANAWLEKNGRQLDPAFTFCFELVAPWNRIVVSYDKEDLILIAAVHTQGNFDWSYRETRAYALSKGITPVYFESRPLNTLHLDDPSVVNQEGYVARFASGLRVKLKYEQYMLLHKIVTGLSTKGIWEALAAGQDIDLSRVPDEFLDWFNGEKTKLVNAYRELEQKAKAVFAETPKFPDRKSYALHFQKFGDLSTLLFAMLDGRDYAPVIWKRVRPVGGKTWKNDEP